MPTRTYKGKGSESRTFKNKIVVITRVYCISVAKGFIDIYETGTKKTQTQNKKCGSHNSY